MMHRSIRPVCDRTMKPYATLMQDKNQGFPWIESEYSAAAPAPRADRSAAILQQLWRDLDRAEIAADPDRAVLDGHLPLHAALA